MQVMKETMTVMISIIKARMKTMEKTILHEIYLSLEPIFLGAMSRTEENNLTKPLYS